MLAVDFTASALDISSRLCHCNKIVKMINVHIMKEPAGKFDVVSHFGDSSVHKKTTEKLFLHAEETSKTMAPRAKSALVFEWVPMTKHQLTNLKNLMILELKLFAHCHEVFRKHMNCHTVKQMSVCASKATTKTKLLEIAHDAIKHHKKLKLALANLEECAMMFDESHDETC